MTGFPATEASKLASPVEFVIFRNAGVVWRYTNSNVIEQIGADRFAPLAIRHDAPTFSKNSKNGKITVAIPATEPVAALYKTGQPVSNITSFTILRRHRNDPGGGVGVFAQGQIAGAVQNGHDMVFEVTPLANLEVEVPRVDYAGQCSWSLYQDRCLVQRESFRHIGTIDVIDPTDPSVITVNGLRAQAGVIDAGVLGLLTDAELRVYWSAGYVETSDGERRTINEGNVDNDGDKVRLAQPFRDAGLGATLTVFAGCDRLRPTCNRKFNNGARLMGFPDIPIVNVFTAELPQAKSKKDKQRFFGR